MATSNYNAQSISILLGNGDGTFRNATTFATGFDTGLLSVADFNKDGKADLAVATNADSGTPQASKVFTGNGDGTFSPGAAVAPSSLRVYSMAVEDFDRDGNPDIVIADGSKTHHFAGGNGNGTFRTPVASQSTTFSTSVITGDFNQDGLLDLVTSSVFYAGTWVSIGRGDGTFQSAVATPQNSTAVLSLYGIGDLDGDGLPDAFGYLVNFGSILIYPGKGDGTLGTPIGNEAGFGMAGLVLADFNRDGKTDIAFPRSREAQVYVGGGVPDLTISIANIDGFTQGRSGTYRITVRNAGEFPTAAAVHVTATLPAGFAATAVDGGGWSCYLNPLICSSPGPVRAGETFPDIRISVSVSSGSQAGNVVTASVVVSGGGETNTSNNSASNTATVRAPTSVALVASPNPSQYGKPVTLTATVPAGTGLVAFYDGPTFLGSSPLAGGQATLSTRQLPAGDHLLIARFTGDSSYGPVNSPVRAQRVVSLPASSMLSPITILIPGGIKRLIRADLDRNGRPDLIVGGPTGVSVLLGNGDGTFQAPVLYEVSNVHGLAAGDLNGDGKPDICISYAWGPLAVLIGNGDGTLQNPAAIPVRLGAVLTPTNLSVSDVNRDGLADLMVLVDDGIRVLLGKGNGQFHDPPIATTIGVRRLAVLTDLDNDGNTDVVDTHTEFSGIRVMMGNGDGTFRGSSAYAAAGGVGAMIAGDMDRDGKNDVVAVSAFGIVSTLRGNGDGTLQDGVDRPYPAGVEIVDSSNIAKTIDLDGDGVLDIAYRNLTWDGISLILSNGTTPAGTVLPTQRSTDDFEMEDFNGDSRVDIAVANSSTNSLQVFLGSSQVIPAGYTGSVDAATCQTISGWAADRSRLNQVIKVRIYDGTKLLETIPANQYRPDVGSALGDNGNHGFVYIIPNGLGPGPHDIRVRYEGNGAELPGSGKTVSCSVNYAGFVDMATCSGGITGWAADRSRLNQAIAVSLWNGSTQLASVLANGLRSDVGSFLGDNGLHAFTIPIPVAVADGVSRSLQVRFESSSTQLASSPVTVKCGGGGGVTPSYAGFVDSVSCATGIAGWAADRNRLNQPIQVSLWDGSTQVALAAANASRPDVGGALGDNGLHGFTIPIPAAYVNGTSRTLQVRFESSSTQLNSSPVTFTCANSGGGLTPNYSGWVDATSCTAISGWAADRKRLNQSISVDLVEGSNVLATVFAGASRPDVGGVLGDNGLHGFTMTTPALLKNGAVRNIQMRYGGTSTAIPNSPSTLQCAAPGGGGGGGVTPNYAGYVDQVGCSVISGWAADQNRLNTSIDLQIYADGSTLLGTVPANALRPDVGAVLGDNGVHGFSFATPLAVKDGRAHAITVRPAESTTVLPGPQNLTCP